VPEYETLVASKTRWRIFSLRNNDVRFVQRTGVAMYTYPRKCIRLNRFNTPAYANRRFVV